MPSLKRFTRCFCIILTLVGWTFTKPAFAESPSTTKVKLVSDFWENYTNKDGTGVYYDLLNEIYGAGGYNLTLMPWKRAQAEFKNGKFDGIVGEDNSRKASYPKWPIDVNSFAALYPAGMFEKWPGAEALKGKRVIWVRGYDVDRYAPGLKATEEVNDLNSGIKMIAAGRADVLIDYSTDIDPALAKLKIDSKKFISVATDIPGGFIYLCFSPDQKGRDLAKSFDERMTRAEGEGKLKGIYNKYEAMRTSYGQISAHMKKP